MKRGFCFLACVVCFFYLSLIYNSQGLLFLAFLTAFTGSMLFGCNLYVTLHLKIKMEIPYQVANKHQEMPVLIRVVNTGFLPSGRICIRLVDSCDGRRRWKKQNLSLTVSGRRIGRRGEVAEGMARAFLQLEHVGMGFVALERARACDYTGFFRLRIPEKRWKERREILVLPRIYQVPVVVNRLNFASLGDREERPSERRKARSGGDSFDIRSYRPGDRLKDIHWKLSARAEELMVLESHPEKEIPVLFFLSGQSPWKEGKGSKKQRRKQSDWSERLYSVIASVSYYLLQQKCSHYFIWFDGDRQELVRYGVEAEEDIYGMLLRFGTSSASDKGLDLDKFYAEQYGEMLGQRKLFLDQGLKLHIGDEVLSYDEGDIEGRLAEQAVIL